MSAPAPRVPLETGGNRAMAAQKDLRLDQGATWRPVLRWQAGSPATPVDLTGAAARLHVRAGARIMISSRWR